MRGLTHRAVDAEVEAAEKADRANPNHIGAPFAGVVSLSVEVGDAIAAGAAIGTIEAMKMEATITSPVAGKVARVAVGSVTQVTPGDLLIEIG